MKKNALLAGISGNIREFPSRYFLYCFTKWEFLNESLN